MQNTNNFHVLKESLNALCKIVGLFNQTKKETEEANTRKFNEHVTIVNQCLQQLFQCCRVIPDAQSPNEMLNTLNYLSQFLLTCVTTLIGESVTFLKNEESLLKERQSDEEIVQKMQKLYQQMQGIMLIKGVGPSITSIYNNIMTAKGDELRSECQKLLTLLTELDKSNITTVTLQFGEDIIDLPLQILETKQTEKSLNNADQKIVQRDEEKEVDDNKQKPSLSTKNPQKQDNIMDLTKQKSNIEKESNTEKDQQNEEQQNNETNQEEVEEEEVEEEVKEEDNQGDKETKESETNSQRKCRESNFESQEGVSHGDPNIRGDSETKTGTTVPDRCDSQEDKGSIEKVKQNEEQENTEISKLKQELIECRKQCATAINTNAGLNDEIKKLNEQLEEEKKKSVDYEQLKQKQEDSEKQYSQSLTEKEKEIERQKAEIESQKAEIESQKAEIERQRNEIESQKAEIESQKAEIESQKAEIESQKAEIERQKAEIERQRNEIESQRNEIERQKAEIERQRKKIEEKEKEIKGKESTIEDKENEIEKLKQEINYLKKPLEPEVVFCNVPISHYVTGYQEVIEVNHKKIVVPISIGQPEGVRYQYDNCGTPVNGRMRDLIVIDRTEQTESLRRQGNDIIQTVFISQPQRNTELQCSIPCIDGRSNITVTIIRQEGMQGPYKGYGMPIGTTGKRGDLYLIIKFN
ncbi:hypothetical protein conserved [Entamoeba histolytica]|uniref:Chaperone DnaJ C-terminal domain-containing protein n=4 Tax=Entamoeba histolytica TaxID=5759 RepID=C4M7R0_ENTH1|nr:hypothetical protein, conserved [Entamoeba histolytica HM-1:IMSS]EAL48964.1 hypothetical protein, conserved [Entamoeba histolytica HM-1:IMSS]GAT97588.1 hypothetical protein conserved [Entamoeba histolytica]|eukprot:XP_654352.1 hypothetical protein, conserved [Entamoeba histolytica HM-1:IMSS]